MAVHILGGPLGEASPLVKFVGPGVREAVYLTSQITAAVDPSDADRLHVVDDARTTAEGNTYYAVSSTHYSDWVGENSETFGTALDAVTYINDLTFDKTEHITRRFGDIGALGSQYLRVDQNVSFDYTYIVDGAFSYFWRETDFPSGVSLSSYDNRRISGVITQTGQYDLQVEITNVSGISTSLLSIEVI